MRKIATKLRSQTAPPIFLGAPTISGTAQVGKTLSALPGNWTNRPRNYAYQWNNEGSPIAGATGSTYVLQTSDLGCLITVAVTASNGAGNSTPAIAFAAAQIKIMPVGDSLTYGTDGAAPHAGIPGGYRAPLWTALQNDGYNIAYVGSQTGNPDPGVLPFSNHEGHGGFTINNAGVGGIKNGIDTLNWLAVQPDIILLNIGINDLFAGRTNAQANTDYGLLLDDILSTLPNVKVICATLVQVPSGGPSWASIFNSNLAAMVKAKGPRVFLADLAAVMNSANPTYFGAVPPNDGTHPIQAGYNEMATVWETAVKAAWPLALGPAISATTFYVSSSIGNDSWDGTAPAFVSGKTGPWASIAHVNAQTFAPGTSVLFKRGDKWDRSLGPAVTGTFFPTGGGSSGLPIVYDAYGTGPNPIIDGSADASTTGAWTNIGRNLWQSVQTFPPLTNVTVTLTGTSGTPIIVTVPTFLPYVNGSVVFATTGVLAAGLIAGTVYYVLSPSGLTFQISATPGGAPINMSGTQSGTHTAGVSGFPYFNANDVGNILWGFAPLGGSAPPAVMSASFGKMTGGGTGGVWYLPGDGTANLGTVQGNWNFNTDNFRVQIYSVGNPATTMPGLRLVLDGGFMRLVPSNPYTTFQNFTFQYAGASTSAAVLASNITFRDCVFQWVGGGNIGGASTFSRGGDGIDPEGSYSNIMIERNYFYQMYDLPVSPQAASGGAHDNLTIRNNIFHHFGTVIGIGLYPNSAGSTQNGLNVYNNTAYGVSSWSANQRPNGGPAVWGLALGYDTTISTTNTNIENNVFAGLGDFGVINFTPPAFSLATMAPIVCDYNNWSLSNGTPVQYGVSGQPVISMQTWRATYGFETHGLVDVDPSFADRAAANLIPAPGSPLLNGGTNRYAAGVVWDFNHKPRPISGPFTMGAFQ